LKIENLFHQVWFSNRRAKYRREDKVKVRRQHQQLTNDMGENMRPSGTTPPAPAPSSSSIYPPMFPSNNPSINNDSPHHHHHQYGAFSPSFTAAAVACSSNGGYPTFFPSKFIFSLIDFYTLKKICFQLQHVVTMGLVHLAHLIIVLVQLIQRVFKQILLPVGEKNHFIAILIFIFT
jgi:hypothetical protein